MCECLTLPCTCDQCLAAGTSRVNITTSGRDNIREQSLVLLRKNGDFTQAQNYSEFHSTFAEKTGQMASWQSAYSALSTRLSEWTFVVVIERAIYFGSLDQESDKTVAILAFSFTGTSCNSTYTVRGSLMVVCCSARIPVFCAIHWPSAGRGRQS